MRCSLCPLCPPTGEYNDDVCPEMDGPYGVEYKDGECGCRHPYNWAKKRDDEHTEYLGRMGAEMGLDMMEDDWKRQDGGSYDAWVDHTIAIMEHALGMDHRKTYRRNGKEYYKPYRNYFSTSMSNFVGWNILTKRGLAEASYNDGKNTYGHMQGMTYSVSELGKLWLTRHTKIIIKPEED